MLWVYYQSQNIGAAEGFQAQLVQAPHFTDEEMEVEMARDLPRSQSVTVTGLGQLEPPGSLSIQRTGGAVLNGYCPAKVVVRKGSGL